MSHTPKIAFSVIRTVLEDFGNTLTEIHAQFTALAGDLAELTNYLQMYFPELGLAPLEAGRPSPHVTSTASPNTPSRRKTTDDAFRLRDKINEGFEVLNNRVQDEVLLPWIEVLQKFEARGSDEVKVELAKIDNEIDDLERLHWNLKGLIEGIPLARPES